MSPPRAGATHADFLITSQERDAAEARLRRAVAEEVLSLEEFGARMQQVLAARTRGELYAAVAGVPGEGDEAPRTARRAPARPARTGGSAIAILSSAETKGRWRPSASTTALAVMGESVIDLQGVEYDGDVLVINAIAAMGDVVIIVPEGVAVDMRGIAVMGDRTDRTDNSAVPPDAPVVQIDGLALMGQVTARHPRPRERYTPDGGRGAFADRVPLRSADPSAMRRERTRSRVSAVRRYGAGVLVALALALPLGWTLTADDVAGAVFGSTTHAVSAARMAEVGDVSVGAPVAFGSIEIRVPEGVNVERDGVVIFGSTECRPCDAGVAQQPTVRIRTVGAFGSVEVLQVPRPAG